MTRSFRSRRLAIALGIVLVLAIGSAATYALFLRGDEVAPLSLPSASQSTGTASAVPSDGIALPSSAASVAGQPADPAGLAGTWTVADGTVVGYRVREKLASLPAQSDAVGRTASVSGTATLTVEGGAPSLTAASFEADLTTLSSDRAMRDNRLRTMGIESGTYPTATFVVSDPIAVPAAALAGDVVDLTLHGTLTLHGVTNAVDIPARGQLAGGQIQVQGSLTFPFSEFGMEPPNIGGFVSVEDDATLEFLIILHKS